MKLDELDTLIVHELQKNGRSSNRRVADALGVSEGTIRQRLTKLEAAKLMRLGVVADAETLGLVAGAYVRIRAEPRAVRDIAKTIASFEPCAFVGLTVGRFDIIAFFNATSREEIVDVIDNQIAVLQGVVAVDVREPVGYAKHRYDLVHIP